MQSKSIGLLGIMRKANAIVTGEQNTGACVKKGQAVVVITAADSSDNAKKRASEFAAVGSIPCVGIPYQKEEIAQITGKTGCSMAAITDCGLAKAFLESLGTDDAETANAIINIEARMAASGKGSRPGKKIKHNGR